MSFKPKTKAIPTTKPEKVRDVMRHWHDQAWSRGPRTSHTIPETIQSLVLFSPELVPVLKHQLILSRGAELAEKLLAHRFYAYADFTSVLEREAVNEVTKEIARKRFWCPLPFFMYRGAGRIYTDEAFHAQESDEIIESLVEQTRVEPRFLQRPSFLAKLDLLSANLEPARRRIALMGFSIVSETLISATLEHIPNDPLVVDPVREFVREHAKDEGRHHAYFTQLLQFGWPGLPAADREFLGPMFAHFVRWFLEPDLGWLKAFLADEGFAAGVIERIIAETYQPEAVQEAIRRAARHSVARFTEVGVLENRRAHAEFVKAGLL